MKKFSWIYIFQIYMRRFSYTLHKYIKVCKRTFPMWVEGAGLGVPTLWVVQIAESKKAAMSE